MQRKSGEVEAAMNGLILKDWLYLRMRYSILGAVVAVWTLILVPLGFGYVAYSVAAFFAVLMPIHAMTVDRSSRWERYALALPRSRREILAARYCFGLLCLGSAATFCFVAALLSRIFLLPGYADPLGISPLVWWMGVMGGALLLFDVIFAVYYRYRTNVGILAIVLVVIVPNLATSAPHLLVHPAADGIAIGLAAAGFFGLWVSWRVSAAAYERWDAV